MRVGRSADLTQLISLVLALEERGRLDEADRRRLDQEFRSRHAGLFGPALLRAWLIDGPSPALRFRLERVRSALSILSWLLAAIGFFLGWAAAAGLLTLEGDHGRINIVLCLGLLVVVPTGFLIASGIGWLVSLGSGGGRDGSAIGRWVRSARVSRFAMRLISPSIRDDVELVLGRFGAHQQLYGGVQRGQFMLWSQILGLAFGLGALTASLGFVVFTDLAFGWSTTLDIEAAALHRWVSALATPWSSVWPDAAPSLELVESTRFFRVSADDHVHLIDPILYGGWWPFLVMILAAYSILPRGLALLGVELWLRREAGRAMALTPGVDRLVDRLATPIIDTRAEGAGGEAGAVESGLVPEVDLRRWLEERGGAEPVVVRWAEAIGDAALIEGLGISQIRLREVGGRRSLQSDADVVAEAAAVEAGVIVCVSAVEPPLLDLLDFLGALRAGIGAVRPLCVLLLGGAPRDLEAWRRKLMGLGDPALCVAHLERRDD